VVGYPCACRSCVLHVVRARGGVPCGCRCRQQRRQRL